MSKNRFSTTIDLALLMLYTVSSIFLCIQVIFYDFSNIVRYIIIIFLFVLLIVLIFVLFTTKKSLWLKRGFIILLTVLLSVFAYTLHYNKEQSLKENTLLTHYRMNLVTNNQNIQNSFELENDIIGVLVNDRNYLSSFEDKNESFNMNACTIKEYRTMENLIKALMNNNIQAMILSDQNIDYMKILYPEVGNHLIYLSSNDHSIQVSHEIKDVDITQGFTVLLNVSDTNELQYVSSTEQCYILFVDPIDHELAFVKLPNDLYVPNVAYNLYPDTLHNISYNGIDNLLYSLENTFNIELDYFVKTNLDTFVNCVDIMQGISLFKYETIDNEEVVIEESINSDNIHEYLMLNDNDISELFVGIFNKREELIGSKLTNFENNFKSSAFTNLPITKLNEIIFAIKIGDWKIENIQLDNFYNSKQPCISYGVYDEFNVSIMNLNYIESLYHHYVDNKHLEYMNNFEFNLNDIKNGTLKFILSNKVITQENMYWKIDSFFSMLPESTINPIEVEKWQDNVNFENPNFDPDGIIYPIE